MKKLKDSQWNDFKGRFQNYHCSFCNHQKLDFYEPKFLNVAGVDVVSVSCSHCGHVEFFDIEQVQRIADMIDEQYRHDKLR